VQFAPPFLRTLMVSSILRYLAVAHFGRGRGNFVEGEAPPFWQAAVEEALQAHCPNPEQFWQALRTQDSKNGKDDEGLYHFLLTVVDDVFKRLYPGMHIHAG
jgi:protein involved in temperature-dependent protein secretion